MEVTGFKITQKMDLEKPEITGFKIDRSITDMEWGLKPLKMPKLKMVV